MANYRVFYGEGLEFETSFTLSSKKSFYRISSVKSLPQVGADQLPFCSLVLYSRSKSHAQLHSKGQLDSDLQAFVVQTFIRVQCNLRQFIIACT